jgi:hypothetical protein
MPASSYGKGDDIRKYSKKKYDASPLWKNLEKKKQNEKTNRHNNNPKPTRNSSR